LELALRSGLKVFTAMLEEDRTAICGPPRFVRVIASSVSLSLRRSNGSRSGQPSRR
jgi:hypothetical protein